MLRILISILLILASPVVADTKVPKSQMDIQSGFAPLAKQATPAVVNIYAKRILPARPSPSQNDPFFPGLFSDFGSVRP